MIDPVKDLTKKWTSTSTRADLVSNQVELGWLTRYPLPSKVKVDR